MSVILLWDADSGKLLHMLSAGRWRTGPFLLPASSLACGCSDGVVRLWNPATGEQVRKWLANRWSPNNGLTTLAFLPDGIDAGDGGVCATMPFACGTRPRARKCSRPRDTQALSSPVQFAADGKTLISLGADSRVIAWDIGSARELKQMFAGNLATIGSGLSRLSERTARWQR